MNYMKLSKGLSNKTSRHVVECVVKVSRQSKNVIAMASASVQRCMVCNISLCTPFVIIDYLYLSDITCDIPILNVVAILSNV